MTEGRLLSPWGRPLRAELGPLVGLRLPRQVLHVPMQVHEPQAPPVPLLAPQAVLPAVGHPEEHAVTCNPVQAAGAPASC